MSKILARTSSRSLSAAALSGFIAQHAASDDKICVIDASGRRHDTVLLEEEGEGPSRRLNLVVDREN